MILQDIGEVAYKDARDAIMATIKREGKAASTHVYEELRNWTWRTLTTRRFDADLTLWHDLIRSVSSLISVHSISESTRLRALSELILQSIYFSSANPTKEVAKREHVKRIVALLKASSQRSLYRQDLLRETGLGQANLSRILSVMASSGIIERRPEGSRVRICLPMSRLTSSIPKKRLNASRVKEFKSVLAADDCIGQSALGTRKYDLFTPCKAVKAPTRFTIGTISGIEPPEPRYHPDITEPTAHKYTSPRIGQVAPSILTYAAQELV